MKRRDFIRAGALAGLAGTSSKAFAQGAEPSNTKQLFEIRTYWFATEDKRMQYNTYLTDELIPRLNQLQITPVGVFEAIEGDLAKARVTADKPHLFLVIPHNSAESFVAASAQLAMNADAKAGHAILDAPRNNPAFVRCETRLLLCFDALPKVGTGAKSPSRLLQMRQYRAHNETKAARKVEMFNKGSIIEIFQRLGFNPVAGGQELAGPNFPNSTYMLSFNNRAEMQRIWGVFWKDKTWLSLWKEDPRYRDTDPVEVTNLILKPTDASQI
jgi:hypothetical protein